MTRVKGKKFEAYTPGSTKGYVLEDIDSTIEKVIETLEYLKKELEQRKHSASK